MNRTQHSLKAHNPDEFTNLYLTGDWTWNALNFGCVEAATISGLLASQAISSYPSDEEIIGLDFG